MPWGSTLSRLWTVAVAVVAVLATAAVLSLFGTLNALWRSFPGAVGAGGWLLVGAAVVLGLCGLWLVLRLPPRWALVFGLLLLVVIRVAAMFVIDPPLVRDPASYNRLALGVLHGECCFGLRPLGYPILIAGAYALGLSGKVVTLLAGLVTGLLLWALGRRLGGERAGVLTLYLYAITPSAFLLTGVLLTEPLYGMVLLLALWALPSASAQLTGVRAAGSGLLVGISQYVRATGIYLAPAFVLPLLARRAWRQIAVFLLLMLLALVPVMVATGGVSTSPLAGWTLLVGTNQAHDGTHNDDDVALYASWGAERERMAREEAFRRIASDPAGFAALAARKAHIMWAGEGYGVFFAFHQTAVPQNIREAVRLVSQIFYAPVFALAAIALWRMRRGPPEVAVVVLGIILTVALIHTFAEVQGRYSAYTVPLLTVLAASLVGSAPWAAWSRNETAPAPSADDTPAG